MAGDRPQPVRPPHRSGLQLAGLFRKHRFLSKISRKNRGGRGVVSLTGCTSRHSSLNIHVLLHIFTHFTTCNRDTWTVSCICLRAYSQRDTIGHVCVHCTLVLEITRFGRDYSIFWFAIFPSKSRGIRSSYLCK